MHNHDLSKKIAALRVIICCILELSSDIDDVNTGLRMLSTLIAAVAQISGLVKVQSVIQQGDSEDSFEFSPAPGHPGILREESHIFSIPCFLAAHP